MDEGRCSQLDARRDPEQRRRDLDPERSEEVGSESSRDARRVIDSSVAATARRARVS